MANNNVPVLTPEQQLAASQKAILLRRRRSEIRQQLQHETLTLEKLLSLDEEAVRHMRVSYLFGSLPGIGKAKTQLFMKAFGIAPNRRIGGLGKRQRDALIDWDRERRGSF